MTRSSVTPRRAKGGRHETPRIILITGQCSSVGKTTLAADIIHAFPEPDWLALKITGHHTDRITSEAGYAFHAESDREGKSDTSRYLAAGANRSFLVEIRAGYFTEAMQEINLLIAGAETVLVEGNSVLEYLHPSLALLVLDPRKSDFKPSARKALSQIDAVVLRSAIHTAYWQGINPQRVASIPNYLQPFHRPLRIGLRCLIRRSLAS